MSALHFGQVLEDSVCKADIDKIQRMIDAGVDVNIRTAPNGWTPLHWACSKNLVDVVVLLLRNGASKSIKSLSGETPRSLSTHPYIVDLLDDDRSSSTTTPANLPSFKRNPDDFTPRFANTPAETPPYMDTTVRYPEQGAASLDSKCQEIVLKLRIANADDTDFVEVDVKCKDLTYQKLIDTCCEELDISPTQIVRLRKLPNTRIRTNRDVQRLQSFQEIEVVLFTSVNTHTHNNSSHAARRHEYTSSSSTSSSHTNGSSTAATITPSNNYQSIFKKDQTILY